MDLPGSPSILDERYRVIVDQMQPWFNSEMTELYSQQPAAPPNFMGQTLLMGCPLWGKDYIFRFIAYCMASLMAPANIAALKGRTRLVLYIPAAARPMLFRLTRPLVRAGVDIIFRDIPDWVMGLADDFNFQFAILGCVHNVVAHMAGRAGMAFHMLMPDHVYGHGYFPNLFSLAIKHDAIVQCGVSTNIDEAKDLLEAGRQPDASLALSEVQLGDIAVKCMHQESKMHRMNESKIPDSMPKSHRLTWTGRDFLQIHSCHENPAWLAPQLVRDAPIAFTSTIDCLLPEYIPSQIVEGQLITKFYTPTIDDGLAFIEISPPTKLVLASRVDAAEFASWCWNQVSFTEDYWPYFKQPTVMRTSVNPDGLAKSVINQQLSQVYKILQDAKPLLMEQFLQRKFGNRFDRDASNSLQAAIVE